MKKNLDPNLLLVDAVDQHQPLGRFLILLFRSFEDDLVRRLEKEGYTDVSTADLNVLRFVRPTGSTSVEIAKLAGVSKQAIAKSIATIEDKGYIKRRKNADDGRSQIIVFTPKGMRLLQTCITAISQIESIYEAKLGKKSFTELKSSIAQLIKIYETK
ncbi:MAG: MarR family winged helix-turn-helix transcriptional regulator [Pirellula sp.]|jgi:DNA-binding MarR family transcriptional regulator